MITKNAKNVVLIFPLRFKLMMSIVKSLFIIVIQIVPIIIISMKIMYINALKDQNVLKNMEGWYMVIGGA